MWEVLTEPLQTGTSTFARVAGPYSQLDATAIEYISPALIAVTAKSGKITLLSTRFVVTVNLSLSDEDIVETYRPWCKRRPLVLYRYKLLPLSVCTSLALLVHPLSELRMYGGTRHEWHTVRVAPPSRWCTLCCESIRTCICTRRRSQRAPRRTADYLHAYAEEAHQKRTLTCLAAEEILELQVLLMEPLGPSRKGYYTLHMDAFKSSVNRLVSGPEAQVPTQARLSLAFILDALRSCMIKPFSLPTGSSPD